MPRLRPSGALLVLFAVLFAGSLRAQTIPPEGTPSTLDVATWNIEWFGDPQNGPSDDQRQFDNVRAVIEQADIDLWALQEVADENDFNALLDALGGAYAGTLATNSVQQRIGFVYKTDIIRPRTIKHILESFASDFASRPPLQMEADVTLGDTTLVVTFIVVHMKAFSDTDSYNKRLAASGRLKNHIDFTSLNSAPVIVLGDFNDELLNSITPGRPSPYENFVQDTDDYFFPTLELDQAGKATFCGSSSSCSSGSTIDHILITDELLPHYVTGSVDRYEALLTALSAYVFTTSDHLPVFARFDLGRPVASEEAPEGPAGLTLEVPFPHPVPERGTVAFTLPHAMPVRLVVYDVLGREVARPLDTLLPAGSHHAALEAGTWAPGLYLVRLQTPSGSIARPFLHRR